MAFSFGNAASSLTGSTVGAEGVTQGPALKIVQTEGLGFLALAGDAKVQLTSKWSDLPAPPASLISIASRKGLVAAAGPDAIHIASTESVRKAFESEKIDDSEVRRFEPQVKVPLPIRISQLAFTADEQYLLLSAEMGGGIAVYDVQSLAQGSMQAVFELPTEGETLRALLPNPAMEKAELCAIVTSNGNLMMANLKDKTLAQGAGGPSLKAGVSCAAWSNKGKQLVAGLAGGTIQQMTPEGKETGHIPKPPSLGDYYVASVVWLENDVFLAIYNPTNGQESSVYNIIHRQKQGAQAPSFTFQSLSDPVEPFVTDKAPHHSVLRLKDFPPNLSDLLLVSSTARECIGLLSRSKTPLASNLSAEDITNVFTTTEFADDSKRAELPMSEELAETFPIGTALDLSSKDTVYRPIPSDEMDQSPGPLPGLWVLNNEGVLAAWWVVYNESIRAGTSYPGLAAVTGESISTTTAPAAASPAPAFGASYASQATANPAFGASAALGAKSSPWAVSPPSAGTTKSPAFGSTAFGNAPATGTSAFGAPSFGSPSALGAKPASAAFGQSSSIGGKSSPWSTGSTATATPAFGQSSFTNTSLSPQNVFGNSSPAASNVPSSGGFASFANKGGFGALGSATTQSGSSIFGSSKPSPFQSQAPEVSMGSDTGFPPPSTKASSASPFGSSPFVLGTTFKADKSSANDNEEPQKASGGSFFGSGFGVSLGETEKNPTLSESRDEDMDATPTASVEIKTKSIFSQESTTPTTTPAPSKFFNATSPAPSMGLFGQKSTSGGYSGLFGRPSVFSSPAEKKIESNADKETSFLPLPPESTSKATYPLGDSSSSSATSGISPGNVVNMPNKSALPGSPAQPVKKADEAPLPPDFLADKAKPEAEPDAAPLPPDFLPTAKVPAAAQESPLPPDFLPKLSTESDVPPAPSESDGLEDEGIEEDEASEEEEIEEEHEEEEEEEEEAEEEEEGENEDDEGSEGSGIDVAKDLSPTTTTNFGHTPGLTPQSSFGGVGGSTFSSFSRPEQDQPRRLFGELGRNVPVFAQPAPTSPRSPSPVRSALPSRILGPDAMRSVSAPGMASHILGHARKSVTGTKQSIGFSEDPNVLMQRRAQARKEAEETQLLVDDEDTVRQGELQKEIEPIREVAEFVIPNAVEAQGQTVPIPAQVETLYRDINRMIDTLGLNSRAIQGFVKGQTEWFKQNGRSKEDLEDEDDWVLCEITKCGEVLDHELSRELESARLKDSDAVLDSLQDINRELSRLRAKTDDLKRNIMSQIDPDQASVTRALPLSAEQAAQQTDLRKDFAKFSKLLSETEEALSILKARIASAAASKGGAALPTVDAVMRTIMKMTSMVEKRSGDVDVLENQMRRLHLGSVGISSPRSREGSPFATPQKRTSVFSPDHDKRSSISLTTSMASCGTGVRATPPRRKMSGYSAEEKKQIREKRDRRAGVLNLLKTSLEKSGPNVYRMTDEDV